ncbi:MAG: amidohydrolase family protein [candidate division NC10 bacterium]|nr:amidohydrolase family protein [candidate division NC10 bacterium]
MFIRAIRKSEQNDDLPPIPPIPTQVRTNEEFIPMPKTGQQRHVDHVLNEYADQYGKVRGLSRREFFQTASGMAAAFLAMNKVYGMKFFDVEEVEAADEAAAVEAAARMGGQFIFDIQTHHLRSDTLIGVTDPNLKMLADLLGGLRAGQVPGSGLKDLNKANFLREVFMESETSMVILSGNPAEKDELNAHPVDQMVRSRDEANMKLGAVRMLAHGLIAPNLGVSNLDDMERQVSQFKISAWKGYTADGVGTPGGWFMDDERVAYPVYEKSRRLGVKHICIHKGLQVLWFADKYSRVNDLEKCALDWPDLNFVIYHSAFPYFSDLANIRRWKGYLTNIYGELGSTFALNVVGAPEQCAHVLGQLVTYLGPDNVCWGTDSIYWGSPQWQIEAFRRFQIPEPIAKGYGYMQLTDEIKAKILGLNAAKVWGIDPAAKMREIAAAGSVTPERLVG